MFDREAINAITEASAIDAAASAAVNASHGTGIVYLPAHFTQHDLEFSLPTRRRARGTMTTARLDDFAAYVATHSEAGAAAFVNPDQMQACAVLNLGTPGAPGHADNLAIYKPPTTAAYDALRAMYSAPTSTIKHSQTKLAEWMEDWAAAIACQGPDGAELTTPLAISAVRAITIEATRKGESVEGQLSTERSALEAVKASARTPLPAFIRMRCAPYLGLQERDFVLRLSVYPDDKAVTLGLRLARAEWHREEMAAELVDKVRQALAASLPVAMGSYSAK
jgi:uncharacterized protein YfdQ (DUF2303 family)